MYNARSDIIFVVHDMPLVSLISVLGPAVIVSPICPMSLIGNLLKDSCFSDLDRAACSVRDANNSSPMLHRICVSPSLRTLHLPSILRYVVAVFVRRQPVVCTEYGLSSLCLSVTMLLTAFTRCRL